MKRSQSPRRIRLSLSLTLYDEKGSKVLRSQRYVKSRIVEDAQKRSWHRGYLKVAYPLGSDYVNDFEFTTLARLKKMLTLFTEYELVKFLT